MKIIHLMLFMHLPSDGNWGSPGGSDGKDPPAMQVSQVQSLGWENPLEKGMAIHSSILVWRIPWTVQSMGHKESDMTE